MNQIIIDDGTREVPICNLLGERICVIRFRPGDISIVDRFRETQKTLKTMFDPLAQISINSDGTTTTDDEWAVLKQVEGALIAELNRLLDTNDAAAIFEKRNAFSRISGKFFCENIIAAIGDLIAETISKETAATQQKLADYMPTEDTDHAGETSEQPDD